MRVVSVRWSTYRIPLRDKFITAHSTMAAREGAIIELFTSRNDIVGLGEIAPLPEFDGYSLDEAIAALALLVNDLRGKTIEEALEYLQALLFVGNLKGYGPSGRLPAATVCGMEIALLDALGKTRNVSMSTLLHLSTGYTNRPYVAVNAIIGAQEIATTVQQAQQMVAEGFSCLKIKMGKEDTHAEIERVRSVRAAIGPTIQLRLDANE